MCKLILLSSLLWLVASCRAQTGCEISNTGADTGIATISATQNMGYSAPGGIGAVGFRIPVSCVTGSVSYHVWRVDTSPSNAPTTYDIGLYCVSGDCAVKGYGVLYVHTGPIYGNWFTNSRTVKTVTGVTVSGSTTALTLTGSFQLPDFPVGGLISISNCKPYNASLAVNSATTTTVTTTKNPIAQRTTVSNCTVTSTTTYPPGFSTTSVCANSSSAPPCQEALPWISDSRTACASIPCTLPAGLYAAAIGTNCNDALKPVVCAQLLGDADLGLIYPLTASSTAYDSGGLPANMNLIVNNTTAVWNTTQGPSAPIKPVKLLIY